MPKINSWMYVSRSRLPTTNAHITVEELVLKWRIYNEANRVTGMLLFTGVRFAQFIEGPASAIAALTASISADDRHEDLVILPPAPFAGRRFADWSLGYSGPSRFVRAAVDKAALPQPAERTVNVENLVKLMLEFAA